jgi:hypothetical protein
VKSDYCRSGATVISGLNLGEGRVSAPLVDPSVGPLLKPTYESGPVKTTAAAPATAPSPPKQISVPIPGTIVPKTGSLTTAVNAANARMSPMVKKLQDRTKSTQDIESPWFRCLLHGEIDSYKTTTACHFGTPEQVRIILTRGEDQLLPVINEGYKYVKVDDAEQFTEALSYCDHVWPDWAKHPEPVLIIDDLTRAKDYVVSASKSYTTDSGQVKEYKDNRKIFGVAMGEFDTMFALANKKPIHIILTALSKVLEGKISLEETVTPDLSPGIGNLIMSDYSFIFFLNKKKPYASRMLTQLDSEAVVEYDEVQKKNIPYNRYYFARHKLPHELVGKGIIKPYEEADLRKVWNKVKAAKAVRKAEVRP